MKLKIKFEDVVLAFACFQILFFYMTMGNEIFDTCLAAMIIVTAWFTAKKLKRYFSKKETLKMLISNIKGIKQVVEIDLHELDKKYESNS